MKSLTQRPYCHELGKMKGLYVLVLLAIYAVHWTLVRTNDCATLGSNVGIGSQSFALAVTTYSARIAVFGVFFRLYCGVKAFPGLGEVHVVWNDLKAIPPPKEIIDLCVTPLGLPCFVHIIHNGSLADRFSVCQRVSRGMRWILMLDDDIRTPPCYFSTVFREIVEKERQDRIIGFLPRHFAVKEDGVQYIYSRSCDRFSMVLTGIAFLPVAMLERYLTFSPAAADEAIREFTSGEDISLNFFAAAYYRTGALFVDCPFVQAPGSGLSTLPGSRRVRERVITRLLQIYQGNPFLHVHTRALKCPVVCYQSSPPGRMQKVAVHPEGDR